MKNSIRKPPQKFEAYLSGESETKNLGAKNDAIDSKFQTLCCPVKTRKNFPSVMVYVMISPNNAVIRVSIQARVSIKKEKFRRRRRNSFKGVYVRKIWKIYSIKWIDCGFFLEWIPSKEKVSRR